MSQATTAHDLINDTAESSFSIQTTELISSLDDYDEDVVGWINHILDERNDSDALSTDSLSAAEQRVAQLSTQLQVVMQDTAAQLEQTIDNVSRTVPRLTYDLQFMREAGLGLQLTLKSVEDKSRLSAADDPTSVALDRLFQLSTIKSRMEAAREVLQEAESWSVLESEVSSLIASEAYSKAGERLAEASRSMVVFQNTSEYENRRALMISLQNQLEAALSSTLVAAINAKEVSTCRSFFTIFGNIQRETEFRNYYFGSRRADLVERWQAASLTDCGTSSSPSPPLPSSSSPLPFLEFFRRFLSELLSRVSEEQLSIPVIFPDAQASLSAFIQSTFDALTPSLSQRLAEMGEHYGSAAITEFIKSFRAAEEFALAVDQIMGKIRYSAFFLQAPGSESGSGGTHGRRMSKRSSMTRRLSAGKSLAAPNISILAGAGVTWEHALFEAFIDLQTEYEALDKRFVDRELARLTSGHSAATDSSRVLQERSIAVFGLAEESLSRCLAFTHGYGAIGLISNTNYMFKTFLEKSQDELIPQILPVGQKRSGTPYTELNLPSTSSDTLEDFDYSPEDWSDVQLALHLLETCRAVRDRLNALESKFKASLIQASNTFHVGQVSGDQTIISLGGTTRGEAELLMQSSLNSAELHSLLGSLIQHVVPSLPSPSTPGPMPHSHTPKSPRPIPLLEPSVGAIVKFTKDCQAFLQGVILKPLHAHLAGYAKSDIWSAETKKANANAFDLQLPSFSLSPSPTIQRVAEGLLNLPRFFEVYADDDALAFSVESLPFVDKASFQALLASPASTTELALDDDHSSRPSAASSPSVHLRRLSSNSITSIPRQGPAVDQRVPAALSPELVSSTWLNSLTLSLLSHLTSVVLPDIFPLSSSGCAQLASDLAYLSNIVHALNVEWGDLERWKEAIEASDEEGKKTWDAKRAESRLGGRREAGYEVWESVAKMRGWPDVAVPS